ncbi:MAG: thioredoxin domain-containing protein [Bauldia sp.]|nr:thioredoxin domain-containing protein [Bauldia sp.]
MVVAQAAPAADPIPANLLPEAAAPAAPVTPEPAPVGDAFTAEEQAAINAIIANYLAANPGFIRDYLVNNPEVIQDAVTELERRRVNAAAAQQAQAIAQYRDQLLFSPRQAVLGNPNGDVTLVEFFDYNCTYCKRALDDMNRLVAGDPNLRIVLKEFPVLGTGSTEAAQVAAAVIMVAPERYDAFHQLLLGSAAAATGQLAMEAAAQVGIDIAAITNALQSNEVVATIEEAYVMAGALGLTGTPSYVIGDEVVVGAVGYDALRARIDSMRRCGQTTC